MWEARSNPTGLVAACTGRGLGWGVGDVCVSCGHWGWCGLADLSCPSQRGEQGSALCKQGPGCFHCTVESKLAVISVQVIMLKVNLCWSSWKKSWEQQLTEQQGESIDGSMLCLACYCICFCFQNEYFSSWCSLLGFRCYKDLWNWWTTASCTYVTVA